MARGDIEVKKADTIFDELDRLHQAISRRAYDLFRNGGTLWDNALTDWLTAEQELISKPAVELRQKDSQFEVLAALPGVEAKDLDVQITPDDVLIKVETSRTRGRRRDSARLRIRTCYEPGGASIAARMATVGGDVPQPGYHS